MKEVTANDIDRLNLGILVLGSLGVLLVMKEFKFFFSFAVASAIMALNFRILKKIIEGGLLSGTVAKKSLIITLPLKFLALAGAVVVVLKFGDINVPFFLFGLSTVFLSVIVYHAYNLVHPVFKRRQNHGA